MIQAEDFKDEHFDDEEDEYQMHPNPQKTYDDQYQQKPEEELEFLILDVIQQNEKEEDSISKDLELKLKDLISKITYVGQNQEEILKMRMHELALSKILVHTHNKSQFLLVRAHHHLGQAYLNYKCYEQAIDHLTISLKKNSKINELSQTKLYHSYVLTTLSRCYYQISSFEDALQVLNRAYDIQVSCGSENAINNIQIYNVQTLKLISNCHLKLRHHKEALQHMRKAIDLIQKKKGPESKEYAKMKIQNSKIMFDQKQFQEAILQLQKSINILQTIRYANALEMAQYWQLLAAYYESAGNFQKQIETLYKKYEIYSEKFQEGHKNTLKLKRTIALLLQKHDKLPEAIQQLQEILNIEQKIYGTNSSQVGKTLKILGCIYMDDENRSSQAEHCLKKAQKILTDYGVPKTVKQIKSKLSQLKQTKQSRTRQEKQKSEHVSNTNNKAGINIFLKQLHSKQQQKREESQSQI